MKRKRIFQSPEGNIHRILIWASIWGLFWFLTSGVQAAGPDPNPPARVEKLIFIHHSCGENWLADNHGGLAAELRKNNYFVSDTNYGWGPDAIGDRTDIENWPEWFTGSNSRRYLTALYRENGRNSPFRRTLADPGGENRIVMFKSCFPNSNLAGRPEDEPQRGDGLTVANAKAIYNELLNYFASRPDKLFIAVTAPPVQDSSHGRNARRFNQWLVSDWLRDYPGQNVAVFDFYNVLTGKRNHHQYRDGRIQYITDRGRDTLAYPSGPGDDHPNRKGNRKATAEFVPLLNVYYNQWLKTAPLVAQVQPAIEEEDSTIPPAEEKETALPVAEVVEPTPAVPEPVGELIDDFESDDRDWQVFLDGEQGTRLEGSRDRRLTRSGKHSLNIDYQVAADGWAMYSLVHPAPKDWSSYAGLVVYVHAEKAGMPLNVTAYGGRTPDALKHFEYKTETGNDAAAGWQKIVIPWDKFLPPSWEGDSASRFDPGRSMGMAIIFSSDDSKPLEGRLWVDDIRMLPRK